MKPLILIVVLVLAGCNGPSPAFRGIEAQRITVGQSTFDVRVRGTRAEAIRLNPEYAPRLAAVAPRGVLAIERVSGCQVVWLDGDQILMRARLDCGDGRVPLRISKAYECEIEGEDHDYADLICLPL